MGWVFRLGRHLVFPGRCQIEIRGGSRKFGPGGGAKQIGGHFRASRQHHKKGCTLERSVGVKVVAYGVKLGEMGWKVVKKGEMGWKMSFVGYVCPPGVSAPGRWLTGDLIVSWPLLGPSICWSQASRHFLCGKFPLRRQNAFAHSCFAEEAPVPRRGNQWINFCRGPGTVTVTTQQQGILLLFSAKLQSTKT